MKFSASFVKATAAVGLLGNPVLAALGKSSLWGGGISPKIVFDNLQLAPWTSEGWEWGWIPQRCFDEATRGGYSPGDMEVFNVYYNDCDNWPWVFCRHHNADLTQEDMIDLFGRLPVHERQYIQHVVAVPGGGSAYMASAVAVYQGPVKVQAVFQHETMHAVDFYRLDSQASAKTAFLDALKADTCVPDNYANNNEIEDFAQIGVVALFGIITSGGLDAVFGTEWQCLRNQRDTLLSLVGDAMTPGGTCTFRWVDSTIVEMGSSTGRIAVGPKPETNFTLGQPNVRAIPFETLTEVTDFSDLIASEKKRRAHPRMF